MNARRRMQMWHQGRYWAIGVEDFEIGGTSPTCVDRAVWGLKRLLNNCIICGEINAGVKDLVVLRCSTLEQRGLLD
jgi:hypothetical protein